MSLTYDEMRDDILEYLQHKGDAATFDEIFKHLGVSSKIAVCRALAELVGYQQIKVNRGYTNEWEAVMERMR